MNRVIFFVVVIALIAINFMDFAYKAYIPPVALILGIILSSLDGSLQVHTKVWATKVLNYAIILLGFGFNLNNILKAGAEGIWYTVISIFSILFIGLLLGKILKNKGKVSVLISAGTAICGGSAIAAIAPVIKTNHEDTAVAMGTIFLLNAVGLILFPILGHLLHLSQHQFGLLAALAIHDTSSVVGSCLNYGKESLMIGTTVKLVRALWIIPVTLSIAVIYHMMSKKNSGESKVKIKKPWFILWFICASLLVTIFPQYSHYGAKLKEAGEGLFVIALFLIGYNVSFANLKSVGVKVFVQAVSLWLLVSIVVIIALKTGVLN